MNLLDERLKQVTEDFRDATDRREMLQLVIDYGEELEMTEKVEFVKEDQVPGCVSDVYIGARRSEDGTVHFAAFTESLVTRGYVAILFSILDGLPLNEILESEGKIEAFIIESDLDVSLVPSRTNAFGRVHAFMVRKAAELSPQLS